jgi:hypothetical protein
MWLLRLPFFPVNSYSPPPWFAVDQKGEDWAGLVGSWYGDGNCSEYNIDVKGTSI